jgi:non-ribosomal peptide synthetase component F
LLSRAERKKRIPLYCPSLYDSISGCNPGYTIQDEYYSEKLLGSSRIIDYPGRREALTESLLNNLKKATGSQIYNMYGPTETTIWSSVKRVDGNQEISIGKPIGNTQFYILDRYQMPLPMEMNGEIYISGGGLARGYLNRAH